MEQHVEIVNMTSKGQLVIPQEVREELNILAGDKLMLIKEKDTIVLRPVKLMDKHIEEELLELRMAARGWEDIEKGHYKEFKSVEELFKALGW